MLKTSVFKGFFDVLGFLINSYIFALFWCKKWCKFSNGVNLTKFDGTKEEWSKT